MPLAWAAKINIMSISSSPVQAVSLSPINIRGVEAETHHLETLRVERNRVFLVFFSYEIEKNLAVC